MSSTKETNQERDEILRRMLKMPPKLHSDSKVGRKRLDGAVENFSADAAPKKAPKPKR
jgi:hypothetical protein